MTLGFPGRSDASANARSRSYRRPAGPAAIVIEALTWDGLDGLFRDADSQPDRQRETDIPEGAEETVPVESEPESGGDAEGPELNPTTEPTARPRRGVLGGIRLLADRFGKWFPGR